MKTYFSCHFYFALTRASIVAIVNFHSSSILAHNHIPNADTNHNGYYG
jgi:hypothetical protein